MLASMYLAYCAFSSSVAPVFVSSDYHMRQFYIVPADASSFSFSRTGSAAIVRGPTVLAVEDDNCERSCQRRGRGGEVKAQKQGHAGRPGQPLPSWDLVLHRTR